MTGLKTPHAIELKKTEEIAKLLNPLVADVFALYVKTKNYHWHLSGPHFRDYHLLFDEQASQVFEMIDTLAERVRKLGPATICSIGQIARLKTLADDDTLELKASEMIKRLLQDNLTLALHMRKAHALCSECQDVATTSLLEVFLDETERRIWFLNSMAGA